ncbi:hypothetical protein KSB_79810 [Ktedonobacter robiniae]|uniref:Uncharacterized protein n=1 Tax=Ktedonobacter robiniae TaxID=2778365 RepID=A0ABQ3V3H8_9CHLR|nr:hypothetical protein KSB_79810 [Ktedonobacter robiniae]
MLWKLASMILLDILKTLIVELAIKVISSLISHWITSMKSLQVQPSPALGLNLVPSAI